MKTQIFDKGSTLAIKTVAVLLMVLYHFFGNFINLNDYYINYFPFKSNIFLGSFESLGYGNFCVSIFLFLTMFGMTRQIMAYQENPKGKMLFWFAARRYMKLIIFFIPIYVTSILLFMREISILSVYGEGKKTFFYMLVDVLGLRRMFDSPTYNPTWWFLEIAIWAIIIFPILLLIYNKISYLILPLAILIPYAFLVDPEGISKYLLTLCLGICFAKERVLERMKEKMIFKNVILNKGIKLLLFFVGILFFGYILSIHYLLNSNIRFSIESIIVVLSIYFIYEFICDIKFLKSFLQSIGKHSATIFYFHTFLFIWSANVQHIIFKLKYAGLIIASIFLISIVYSIALEQIKKITGYNKLTNKVIIYCESKMRVKKE